jgi:hypothetical protein
MNPRRDPMSAPARIAGRLTTPRPKALDDAWDERMTGLLRAAAEVREERQRRRLREDELLAQRETAALLSAIGTRARQKVKHHIMHPQGRRAAGSTRVIS